MYLYPVQTQIYKIETSFCRKGFIGRGTSSRYDGLLSAHPKNHIIKIWGFKIPKIGIIAGCYVKEGKVIRNSLLRVRRENEIIYEGKLTSLKRFKEDASEVLSDYECGIGIEGVKKYDVGDVFEIYEMNEVKRKLV